MCERVTVMPQYVFSALCRQICGTHFDWHKTKSWSVVCAYLLADVWSAKSLKTKPITNNSAQHLEDIMYYMLTASQRLGMQRYSPAIRRRQVKQSAFLRSSKSWILLLWASLSLSVGSFANCCRLPERCKAHLAVHLPVIPRTSNIFATNILTLPCLLSESLKLFPRVLQNEPVKHTQSLAENSLRMQLHPPRRCKSPPSLACSAEPGVLTRAVLGWRGVRTGWDIREWHGIGGHAFWD